MINPLNIDAIYLIARRNDPNSVYAARLTPADAQRVCDSLNGRPGSTWIVYRCEVASVEEYRDGTD
jgi:hypothetical protein